MTNEQAMTELKKRIEKTEVNAREQGLVKEFWEPGVECYRMALRAMEFYEKVQGMQLPSYAEHRAKLNRIERKLQWMGKNMPEADIDEMLEAYYGEPIDELMAESAVSEYKPELRLREAKEQRRQMVREYESSLGVWRKT